MSPNAYLLRLPTDNLRLRLHDEVGSISYSYIKYTMLCNVIIHYIYVTLVCYINYMIYRTTSRQTICGGDFTMKLAGSATGTLYGRGSSNNSCSSNSSSSSTTTTTTTTTSSSSSSSISSSSSSSSSSNRNIHRHSNTTTNSNSTACYMSFTICISLWCMGFVVCMLCVMYGMCMYCVYVSYVLHAMYYYA